jgi:hypothetical protein
MYEFNGEKIVLDELKNIFKSITLQSDFYDEYILGNSRSMQASTSTKATTRRSMSAFARTTGSAEPSRSSKRNASNP